MTDHLPDGAVVITPAAMYAEMRATHDVVLQMSGKLDTALTGGKDHEERVRTLEKTVGRLSTTLKVAWGAIGVVIAGLGVLAGFVQALRP